MTEEITKNFVVTDLSIKNHSGAQQLSIGLVPEAAAKPKPKADLGEIGNQMAGVLKGAGLDLNGMMPIEKNYLIMEFFEYQRLGLKVGQTIQLILKSVD